MVDFFLIVSKLVRQIKYGYSNIQNIKLSAVNLLSVFLIVTQFLYILLFFYKYTLVQYKSVITQK